MKSFAFFVTLFVCSLGSANGTLVPEYIFQIPPSEIIYVESSGSSYSGWKVYRGAPGDLRLIETNPSVSRYRDGGTTDIRMSDGSVIHSPTPFKKAPSVFTDANGLTTEMTSLGTKPEVLTRFRIDITSLAAASASPVGAPTPHASTVVQQAATPTTPHVATAAPAPQPRAFRVRVPRNRIGAVLGGAAALGAAYGAGHYLGQESDSNSLVPEQIEVEQ